MKYLSVKKIINLGILCFSICFFGCGESEILDPNDEKAFIEIFHALEIDFNKSDTDNDYLDYIIQKYRLWDPGHLKKYKSNK